MKICDIFQQMKIKKNETKKLIIINEKTKCIKFNGKRFFKSFVVELT